MSWPPISFDSAPPPLSDNVNATTLSVSIERASREVSDFVSEPRNLPRWAAGLARSVRADGDSWIAETAQGPVRERFAAANALGEVLINQQDLALVKRDLERLKRVLEGAA